MLATALLTLTLGFSPGSSPTDVTAPIPDGQVCSPIPPEPTRTSVMPFAETTADGTRVFGADATYALSSGDVGEAFFVIGSDGVGEAQLMINGDVIAHVAIATDAASGQPITTTWHPPAVEHPPELIAEMMRVDLPVILAESLPQEYKCSPGGKKLRRAVGILFRAVSYAAQASCCIGTLPASPAGCLVCATGIGVISHEVGKALDEHCD